MISFIKTLVFLYFSILSSFSESVIITGSVPKSLWGKKVFLNGPITNLGYATQFDGIGHITCTYLHDNINTVVSTVDVPTYEDLIFPLGDFIERNYLKIISKLPYTIFGAKNIQSGTRNTVVLKYNNKYYAVEESCKPIELILDSNNILKYVGKSNDIDRMGAHMVNDNTIFSYTPFLNNPLKFNNTHYLPWRPKKQPGLVHDCISIDNKDIYIFPFTSTGMGSFDEYISGNIDLPFDDKLNKAGWIIYDKQKHTCNEIIMDDYADIFHIAHIENIHDNIYKIYAPFLYGFTNWLTNNNDLEIYLKEVIIDIDKKKIIDINNTGIRMDFIHKKDDELIGSAINKTPIAIFYNINTKKHRKLKIPGGTVREIIPYRNMLIYYSHETPNTYLYIVDNKIANVITKIQVPNRPAGYHTTLLD